IVAASVYRREFLDAGTTARVWWILWEAGFGFVLYWVGHYLAVCQTIKHWADEDFGQHFDPLCVWRYALAHLPRTQLAVYAGFWGATARVAAIVLYCLNDYSAKDRTTRPPKYGSVVGKAGGGGSDEYEYSPEPSSGGSASSRRRGPTRPIDTGEPPP